MSESKTPNPPAHIIGHLDWPTRARFVVGVAIALGILGSIGFSVLRPWDPFGAISLQLVDGKFLFAVRATAVLLAAAVLATIIFDGRLPQFGTFAASIGLCYPVVKTGGMDYLMVRLQEDKEFNDPNLWGYLALEVLAWLAVAVVVVLGSTIAERWVRDETSSDRPTRDKARVSHTQGLLGLICTAVIAAILIGIFCQSRQKGQVIFAVAAAFFLAAWAGDWATGNRQVIWQLAAVPAVAFGVYVYTWMNPARPAGLEAILYLTPNNLAAVLPVEYFAAGLPAAIFGFWTSERLRFSDTHQ